MNDFSNIESGRGILKDSYNEDNAIEEALKRKNKNSFDNFKTKYQDPTNQTQGGDENE